MSVPGARLPGERGCPASLERGRPLRVLLIGPRGHGGEEVYVRSLRENPPDGVQYVEAGSFHEGAPGAPCRRIEEVLLNRLVHPWLIPDMGFRSLALKERFDLIHVHAHPIRLANMQGAPLVMSEGSCSAVYLGEYLNWDERRLRKGYARARRVYRWLGVQDRLLNLSRVSQVYVFSRWARDINVNWGADPGKLSVLYPGFPTPPPVDLGSRRQFTFLFVGTDFERKGGFEVVEAFEQVVARQDEARLAIISSDPHIGNPDRAFHSWVSSARRKQTLGRLEALERSGVVTRWPLVDRSELYRRIFPMADAFVMPSHAEGFGFTNVEAMSFGLPVISSTVGPIPEIVAADRTGFLVPPGDVGALSQAMERLLVDKPGARLMGDAARADFLSRFTEDRFRAGLAGLYLRALGG